MILQDFNSVRVLFVICLFEVEVVKAVTTTSSSSSHMSSNNNSIKTSYKGSINNGELGLKIEYDSQVSSKIGVTLFYDTETNCATDFFQQQFTDAVFQGFTDCNVVDWHFNPCGTSRVDETGKLICPRGQTQCTFNAIHACVATLYADKPKLVAQFILCFFNNSKDNENCITSIPGLVQNDINQCVSSNAGISDCGAFFVKIHGAGPHSVLSSPTGSASMEFTTDFKGLLCDQVSNAKLTCNYCSTPSTTPPPS